MHSDGYAQSKWVSEQLVQQARNRGLTASIIRYDFFSFVKLPFPGWEWFPGILKLEHVI